MFHRPPRKQKFLKDISGQPLSLAPCLPSPACPSSKPRHSNLRAHTALTTLPLHIRPPNGFPFPTADSPSSFSQPSRPPAVWPQVHFLLLCPPLLSMPLSGLFIPPPQAVFGPHPAFAYAVSPPWNALSFLSCLSPTNSCSVFNIQWCLPMDALVSRTPWPHLHGARESRGKPIWPMESYSHAFRHHQRRQFPIFCLVQRNMFQQLFTEAGNPHSTPLPTLTVLLA